MSTRPDEALLDAVADSDVLSDAVEAHLDAWPLPVDEAEVDRIAATLHRRIAPQAARPPHRLLWLAAAVALAAGLLLTVQWASQPTEMTPAPAGPTALVRADVAPQPREVRKIEAPGVVPLPSLGRTLLVDDDSSVLVSTAPRSVVVLVQEGAASSADVAVPPGHWAVLGPTQDGVTTTVVFPDGQRPPAELDGALWLETPVHVQLEELRWKSLPEHTLNVLDGLLEER